MKILHFKTNVQLKNIIGRDLINDDNVAIQELVKNSYDAGSKKVEIIFRNLKSNEDDLLSNETKRKYFDKSSKIFIIDSGEGMSDDELRDKWLNIAYSSKKTDKERFDRVMAGAKGVGRFSCDRLGEYLEIYTKSKSDKKINHLSINWNDFEIENDINFEIQKVDIILNDPIPPDEFKKKTGFSIKKSCTILEISKLRENWISKSRGKFNYDKLVSLKNSLEKLTNPNQNIDKQSFIIESKIEDLSKTDFNLKSKSGKYNYDFLNSPVENKIFKELSFRTTLLESEISKDGTKIITSLKDRDKLIFKLIEKNPFKQLKDIKIVLHFLNQYSKAYFKRHTGIHSIQSGSIFLFINGFRVAPFGDYGNDWLGLETRKGQGRARYLGTRDLIGRVEINDSKNVFKIISSREGLVKNNAHNELVGNKQGDFTNSFFYSVFRKLEVYVVKGLDWDRVKRSSKSGDNIEEDEKFEVKQIMKDFNEKLDSKLWVYDPSEEIYAETQDEKNFRVLEQIYKVITVTTRKENIISIYINEELLQDIAQDNIEKIESVLNSVKYFDISTFDVKTSKGIDKIQKTLEKLSEKAKQEKEKRQESEKRVQEETRKREVAEKERDKAREDAEKEKEKRQESEKKELFIKSLIGKDTEEIVKLQHQIKLSSKNIRDAVLYLKEHFIDKENIPSKNDLLDIISRVLLESDKIRQITYIATSADFDLKSRDIKEDIIKFAREYVLSFKNTYLQTSLDDNFQNFIMDFSPLEIQVVIDNIYSNAKKADAKNMQISFKKISEKELVVKFLDDGEKVDSDIIQRLFEFGFTTRKGGSGIGLYNVKQIINSIKSEVEYIQSGKEKGIKLVLKR